MSKVATSKTTKTATKVSPKTSCPTLAQTPAPVETTETTVETTTVEATVVEATSGEGTTTVAEITSLRERFDRLIKAKQDLMLQLKAEVAELRKMQREHELALKDASKRGKKKKAPRDDSVPRKPSGFASPVVVSDELYSFLARFGVKKGQPIARTDVTRHVTSYIKENDLQNPENRREIVPDATLKALFGEAAELSVADDESSRKMYTYLKLQRYMSPHFPKKQQQA